MIEREYVQFTLRSGKDKGKVVKGYIERRLGYMAWIRYFHNGCVDARWLDVERLTLISHEQFYG